MTDNVTLPGTGDIVASDIVGTAHYQRIKLDVGGDGVADPVVGALPSADYGPDWTSSYLFTASADATGGADITAAPTAGQKIVVTDILISVNTAMYVSFLEETSGTELGRIYLPANGAAQVTPRSKWKLPVADKKLRIGASVAGAVAVTCWYYSEA